MEWWEALIVALITMAFTKVVDHLISISKEKREFKKLRRQRMLDEIEGLKDEIGRRYELAASWKPHEIKMEKYNQIMSEDDYLVGKYSKYPAIGQAARDTLHWCGLVAYAEQKHEIDVVEAKKELSEKHA